MNVQDERAGLISASSGERRFNCAGSKALEDQAPEGTPTDEAIQGDEIHEAKKNEDFTGLDEEGRTIAEQLTVLEQRAYAEFVQNTKEEPFMLREERLWIKDRKTKQRVASAQIDVGWIGKKNALVIDLKTGYLAVTPAYRNIQSRIQALAVWHEYPSIDRIVVGIAAYRFKGTLDMVDYSLDALKQAEQELFFHVWRSQQPHAPRVPGAWCKYCRAKAYCPEATAMTMLPAVPFGPEPMKKKDIPARVMDLTLEQLAFIHQRSAMIKNVLDAVSDRLKSFGPDDLATVGYKLEPGGTIREIPSIPKLWEAVWAAELGITVEEFQGCMKAFVGKVEELVASKIEARELASNPEFTKKEAKARAAKIIEPAVELKPKSPQLKPLKALPE